MAMVCLVSLKRRDWVSSRSKVSGGICLHANRSDTLTEVSKQDRKKDLTESRRTEARSRSASLLPPKSRNTIEPSYLFAAIVVVLSALHPSALWYPCNLSVAVPYVAGRAPYGGTVAWSTSANLTLV